ncbi:MAG: Inorganic pyrophosphatase [Gammaproteobacteria bacterium]|nr:Inorganic pyrophosphatase [Gammaproteobacteria bacterium]
MAQATDLPARSSRGTVNVIIDTPQGSRNKYKYDPALELFKLSRRLPNGMHFPHDFGFIPGTLSEDGDALDVVILTESPGCVGCLMTVRLIGAIRADQVEQRRRIRNDRLVGVAVTPVNRPRLRQLKSLPQSTLVELEQFFVGYNRVHGRKFEPNGRLGARAAELLVDRAIRMYARRGHRDS